MWRLFALIAVACIALLGWPDAVALLRWQRGALGDGQVWRMLSAHFAHLGPWHALANLAGMALVIELLGAAVRPAEAVLLLLASALAIVAGLFLVSPAVGWYAGLSGVVHGWWAGFALLGWWRQRAGLQERQHIRQQIWQQRQQQRQQQAHAQPIPHHKQQIRRDWLPAAALGVLLLKLALGAAGWLEWQSLLPPRLQPAGGILPVVPQSHVYGAVGGALAALALLACLSREAMQHEFGLE